MDAHRRLDERHRLLRPPQLQLGERAVIDGLGRLLGQPLGVGMIGDRAEVLRRLTIAMRAIAILAERAGACADRPASGDRPRAAPDRRRRAAPAARRRRRAGGGTAPPPAAARLRATPHRAGAPRPRPTRPTAPPGRPAPGSPADSPGRVDDRFAEAPRRLVGARRAAAPTHRAPRAAPPAAPATAAAWPFSSFMRQRVGGLVVEQAPRQRSIERHRLRRRRDPSAAPARARAWPRVVLAPLDVHARRVDERRHRLRRASTPLRPRARAPPRSRPNRRRPGAASPARRARADPRATARAPARRCAPPPPRRRAAPRARRARRASAPARGLATPPRLAARMRVRNTSACSSTRPARPSARSSRPAIASSSGCILRSCRSTAAAPAWSPMRSVISAARRSSSATFVSRSTRSLRRAQQRLEILPASELLVEPLERRRRLVVAGVGIVDARRRPRWRARAAPAPSRRWRRCAGGLRARACSLAALPCAIEHVELARQRLDHLGPLADRLVQARQVGERRRVVGILARHVRPGVDRLVGVAHAARRRRPARARAACAPRDGGMPLHQARAAAARAASPDRPSAATGDRPSSSRDSAASSSGRMPSARW